MSYTGEDKGTSSEYVPLLCVAPVTIAGAEGILPSSAIQKIQLSKQKTTI